MFRSLIRWLWYVVREASVEPLYVDFPSGPGPLRFVFSNVEKAPCVILWCHDRTVISASANVYGKPNEISVDVDKPVVAVGTMEATAETFMSVFRGAFPLTRMGISAYACDVSRMQTYYVPRWRVVLEWLRRERE